MRYFAKFVTLCAFFTICTILFCSSAFAQEKTDHLATEILTKKNFKGTALYGFMNGGSDLYYEYGFKELDVTQLNATFIFNGALVTEKYTVEIYKMETPQGAFGLYSTHVHKFLKRDQYGFFDCMTNYQLQSCVAAEYISIVFDNSTAQAREGADLLYKNYLNQLQEPIKFAVPEIVTAKLGESLSGRLKLVQGQIALNNSAQDLYPLFEGFTTFNVWFTNEFEGEELFYKAVIQFPTADDAQKFAKKNAGSKISDDFAPAVIQVLSDTELLLCLQ
ncbi:MAG: DUF6599 family protein [Bacteroidales bacterium]